MSKPPTPSRTPTKETRGKSSKSAPAKGKSKHRQGKDSDIKLNDSSRWIWPFELLQRIGEGGMGVVYRARYVIKNHEVALKMMPEDVTDETTLARFEREMEVLKGLKHPNIVRTFGGISEDKQRFYAMELLPGGSLEEILRCRGRLSWETVIDYGLQMCSALAYLHSQGVVHRDVKPSNFLIASDGRLKLSDFGLASVLAARRITAAGRTAGTFLYMAPEQIRGETITPRTDLYALGCVLFELLTGQPPYVGETPAATLHMHCKSPIPRVAERALDCPPSLERIVARLLEKAPQNRYQSASAVAKDLKEVSQSVEIIEHSLANMAGGNLPTEIPSRSRAEEPSRTGFEALTEAFSSTMAARPKWRNWLEISMPIVAGLLLIFCFSLLSSQQTLRKARELWVSSVSHKDPDVRINALRSLAKMASEEDLRLVADRMQMDPDPHVRTVAAEALGLAGDAATPFIPNLIKAQKKDPNQQVRVAASLALSKLKRE